MSFEFITDVAKLWKKDKLSVDNNIGVPFIAQVTEKIIESEGGVDRVVGYKVGLGANTAQVDCARFVNAEVGDLVACTRLANGEIIVTNRRDGDGAIAGAVQKSDEAWDKATDVQDRADRGEFDGADGQDGKDGETPYVGQNGHWWIGTVDTGWPAQGDDGHSPYISNLTNTWWEWDPTIPGYYDTHVVPKGQDGADGRDGTDGKDGKDGTNGLTPYVGSNGNWWIGTTDTGYKAEGDDGHSPYIDLQTGTWWEWDADEQEYHDTYIVAEGQDGQDGQDGRDGEDGRDGQDGRDGEDGQDGEDGTALYGYCTTSATSASKDVYLSNCTLNSLKVGTTISVKFSYGNTATNPKIDVYLSTGKWSGYKPMMTNGVQYAYWAGQTEVLITWDGTYWQVASSPVYANTVTVGNSAAQNVYIDSDSVDIRYGSTVQASFQSNKVSLCQNKFYINYDTSADIIDIYGYDFNIGTQTSGDISFSKAGLVIFNSDSSDYNTTLYANGGYVSIDKYNVDITSNSDIIQRTGSQGEWWVGGTQYTFIESTYSSSRSPARRVYVPMAYGTASSASGKAMYINSNGWLNSSSSKREYKEDITSDISPINDPDQLYELPVRQFKYKEGHIDEDDYNFKRDILGFIAEEVSEIYHIGAYHEPDGTPCDWEVRIIVPAMLKLIQRQHEEILQLRQDVDTLKQTA